MAENRFAKYKKASTTSGNRFSKYKDTEDFASSVELPSVNLAQAKYDALPGWRKPIQAADDLARMGASGLTFGFFDKGLAAADAMLGRGSYDASLQKRRRETEDSRSRAGIPGMVMEIGGSVLPVAKAAQIGATATRLPGALGKFGGMAIDGAAAGALTAAGNDQDIGTGATLGAGFGAVGQAVGNVVSTVARPLTSRLFPETGAARVMDKAMKEANATPKTIADDLARAYADRQGGSYAVMDAMGYPGQRLASTVVRTPNEGRTPMVEFLENRQAGQGRRVSDALAEGFDATDTAAQRQATLTKTRDRAADLNYSAARQAATDVDVMPAVSEIDTILGGAPWKDIASIRPDSIEGKLLGLRGRLVNADGSAQVIGFDEVLRLKQDLDDIIEPAKRAGQSNLARLLGKVRNRLDQSLEQASPPYARARDAFRSGSKAIEAVDTGRNAAMRGRYEDTIPAFNRLSDAEKRAFRAGYADPLIAQTQQAAMGTNKARPLMSDATAAEFPAFAAPGQANRLGSRLRREQTMFETRQTALGGSKTADNMADEADISLIDPSVIGNLLSGNLGGATKNAILQGISALKGQPPQVRALLSKALRETNPLVAKRNLENAVKRINVSDQKRQAIVRTLMLIATAGTVQSMN